MKLILKDVKIVDPHSEFHMTTQSIRIENGQITDVSRELNITADEEILEFSNGHVSPGWFDVGTMTGEPGFEYREDLNSVTEAAIQGGYTGIACFPNTDPVLQSKGQLQYILNFSRNRILDILPIGSLSKNHEGAELCELMDLYHSGAIAFSDGIRSVQNNGLMLRALEYVKSINGLIIHQALDEGIAGGGLMHEGKISTQLGLPGITEIAEKILVERDLSINEYADSRILIHNISSAGVIQLISTAKTRDLRVYASVPYMNLIESDEALLDFDVNHKVLPPLRSKPHKEALIQAIREGVIEVITSNHMPIEQERKDIEFAHSEFGAIGLETCFAALITGLKSEIELSTIIECISCNPRRILGLPAICIEKGQSANLTIFDPDHSWTYDEGNIRSKSKNSPYLGKSLVGKPLAIVNKNQLVRSRDTIV